MSNAVGNKLNVSRTFVKCRGMPVYVYVYVCVWVYTYSLFISQENREFYHLHKLNYWISKLAENVTFHCFWFSSINKRILLSATQVSKLAWQIFKKWLISEETYLYIVLSGKIIINSLFYLYPFLFKINLLIQVEPGGREKGAEQNPACVKIYKH